MNRLIHKPALLGAAMVCALGLSAPAFAVDAGAPGRAVQGSNPSAPSTQNIPSSGTNNSSTNGSAGNPSANPNNSDNTGAIGNGTGTGTGTGGNSTGNSAAPGTSTGTTGGTLEDQRRASGDAMERERTGE